jgi:hypothetical protein
MTVQEFAPIFGALAVQLRQTDADEVTIRSYHDAMKDLEPEFVAMAARSLAQSSEWFPKTSEWIAEAAKIERERTEELRARLRNLPIQCVACDDTGWAPNERNEVTPCDCRKLRRLEILGRRPMPELTSGGTC